MNPTTPATPDAPRRGVVRRLIKWLLSLKGSPPQIALGLAVGVFVGFSPLWGMHMFIAAGLATMLGASRPAAVAAVWISNPLTVVPIYTLTYRVGHAFVPGRHADSIAELLRRVIHTDGVPWWNVVQRVKVIFEVGEEVLIPLAVGGLMVGTLGAVLSYLVARPVLTRLRQSKRPRKRFRQRLGARGAEAEPPG